MITKKDELKIFIWIIIIVFSSCEKDQDFPKKYVFDSFLSGDIKAYTKGGEITNDLTINNFIKEQKDHFWQPDYQSDNWQIELEIISETKAKISTSDTSIDCDLIRKDGILYFQLTDTMISQNKLTNDRLKYSPLFVQSYGMSSKYLFCYYIIESDRGIYIPIVSYLEKIYGKTGDLTLSQLIGNHNNAFNATYLNKVLNSGGYIDTIVYQDNKVIFKEK